MNIRLAILVNLSGCVSDKAATDTTHDSGAHDSGPDTGSALPLSATTIAALPWKVPVLVGAGTSGAGSQRGFWLNSVTDDPSTSDEDADVYRVPWGSSAASIQAAAEVVVVTPPRFPVVVGFQASTLTVIGEGAAGGEVRAMGEPTASGALDALTELTVTNTEDDPGTWNLAGWLDVDADGAADDLVAGGAATGRFQGRLAVLADAPTSGALADTDMDLLGVCEGAAGLDGGVGAMAVVEDADGSFWVTCGARDHASGYAEHRVTLAGAPDERITEVSGWSAAPDPRGGVWLGAEGAGEVVYARTDGTAEHYAMDGFPFFGAAPAVAVVGDRIILAVGALGTYEAPASAVYVYEITGSTDLDALPYNRLDPEGDVLCLGGVNALVERPDGLYAASSGFLADTLQGCGVQEWKLDL